MNLEALAISLDELDLLFFIHSPAISWIFLRPNVHYFTSLKINSGSLLERNLESQPLARLSCQATFHGGEAVSDYNVHVVGFL